MILPEHHWQCRVIRYMIVLIEPISWVMITSCYSQMWLLLMLNSWTLVNINFLDDITVKTSNYSMLFFNDKSLITVLLFLPNIWMIYCIIFWAYWSFPTTSLSFPLAWAYGIELNFSCYLSNNAALLKGELLKLLSPIVDTVKKYRSMGIK